MADLRLDLTYIGSNAENHELDFYDAAIALVGFQRSLALTTHVVLNDQVITQAPALKGARIRVLPPEPGSWKVTALVGMTGAAVFHLGTAPKDTPLGHLVSSAYDYVISEALGFHVDYDKSLGQQYEELQREGISVPGIARPRLDSVVEKCEVAVRDMHRPIVVSETATSAQIERVSGPSTYNIGHPFSRQTFDHMQLALPDHAVFNFSGRVSSYNMNTFKGRIFLDTAERPIPFEFADEAKTPRNIMAITRSLAFNAGSRTSEMGILAFQAIPYESRTGRLRSLLIIDVASD